MIQLHETAIGRKFYERDVPELIRQLAGIRAALERLADREAVRELDEGAEGPGQKPEGPRGHQASPEV